MPGKANNLSLKLSVPFEPVKEAGNKKMVITSHSVEKNISSNVNNPWKLKVSQRALGIVNPIRQVIEQMGAPRSDKKMIPLSQGDPTLFGNLRTCNSVLQAVVETTTSGRGDGVCSLRVVERQACSGYQAGHPTNQVVGRNI